MPTAANANPSGESTGSNGPLVVNGANDAGRLNAVSVTSGGGGVSSSGAVEMTSRATGVVCCGDGLVAVSAVMARGAADSCTVTSRTVSAFSVGAERAGVTPAFSVTVLAATRRTPVEVTGCRLFSGRPTDAPAAVGASGLIAVVFASRFGGAEPRVSTGSPPTAEMSLLGFFDDCAPPVAFTVPGCVRRTDAFDAPALELESATGPDPGVEMPFVLVTAAVEVPAGLAVVPVFEVPWVSEAPLVPPVPPAPVDPPEGADGLSSAHATPGVLATAIPIPKATANPPTRPTKHAALTTASQPSGQFDASQRPQLFRPRVRCAP